MTILTLQCIKSDCNLIVKDFSYIHIKKCTHNENFSSKSGLLDPFTTSVLHLDFLVSSGTSDIWKK